MSIHPWFQPPKKLPKTTDSIAIIGAGIMGCLIAHKLQELGYNPVLFEENEDVFSEGSGNPVGILDPFISLPNSGPESAFFDQAFKYAIRFYQNLGGSDYFSQTGLHKIPSSEKEFLRFKKIAKAYDDPLITIKDGGLFFANSGYIFPQKIGQKLRQNLTIRTGVRVNALEFMETQGLWELHDGHGNVIHQTQNIILCNAHAASHFAQTNQLPLEPVKGQITYLKPSLIKNQEQSVFCKSGYLTPQISLKTGEKIHILGATFERNIPFKDRHLVTAENHQANILKSPLNLEPAENIENQILGGRAAFRAMLPDHMPLLGAVPDLKSYDDIYKMIHFGSKHKKFAPAPYHTGLFICAGLGSRGLLTAPFLSQLFADFLTQNQPEERYLSALHPARFFIRQKIKGYSNR